MASHQVVLFEQRPGDELEQRQHVDQPLLLQAQQTQHFAELLALHATVLKNTKHPFVAVSSYLGINAVKSFGCYSLLTVKKGGSLFFTFGFRVTTSHLGRLVQLLCPLHDPLLGLLIGVFVFLIFKPLTLGCPGGVLQELRTQNQ